MFKKLALVLCLVLTLAISGVWGFSTDEECEVSVGSKIFLIPQPGKIVPVMANVPLKVTLGEVIPDGIATKLNEMSTKLGSPMEWTGARIAVVSVDGNLIVVREDNMNNCPPSVVEE